MLFLIVHHPGGFPPFLFARPPHAYTGLLKVFHLLYSIRLFCSQKPVQDTHGPVVGLVAVCVSRWRGFCKVPVDGRKLTRPGKVVQMVESR